MHEVLVNRLGGLSLPRIFFVVVVVFFFFFFWLFVFNIPLRQYFSLYRAVSQRGGERKGK